MKFCSIEDLVRVPKELAKAYTEGVYADTPQNRKLGRVGMSYKEWTEKQVIDKEDLKTEKITSFKEIPFKERSTRGGTYEEVELKDGYVLGCPPGRMNPSHLYYIAKIDEYGHYYDMKEVSKKEAVKIYNERKKENSSKDKKDDNFIKSITNQLQESLNENSIYCYEVNTKETEEGNTIFEAICSKDDLAGITTMNKSGQKLKEKLRPLLGGLELQDISLTNYKGEKQIKLIFDF